MPQPLRTAAAVFGSMLCVVLGVSCADFGKPTIGAAYVVTVPRTPFYRFGPMQNQGPDAMLELGTKVTLVSREYGYSRFMTAQGVVGYAATNDFALAPKPRPTPPPLPPLRTAQSGKRRGSAPTPQEKKLDLGDLPAPEMPSGGAQSNPPGFRMTR